VQDNVEFHVPEGTADMMLIACMARRLNPDVDYAAFRRAWIPDEIIDDDPRRRVLSGINLEDPRDLFTIAIIEDADPAEIPCGWSASPRSRSVATSGSGTWSASPP
jgi:hypothetical protein